jgi:hypothetical protein
MERLTLCKVLTQYYDENGKLKGGMEFQLRVDSDFFFYCDNDVIALAFQKMIDANMQRYCGKYVYLSHELVFHETLELNGDFESIFKECYDELHPNEN